MLARFPIGIAILAPSKVLALRAVVEVLGLDLALLEEEDGKVIVPPLTRTHPRRLLYCFHQPPCSCDFRCLRLCLVRPNDGARGHRDGGGYRETRGAASRCHLRREISEISNPLAL